MSLSRRVSRVAVATVVLAGAARPAGAELVLLTTGRTLSVKSHTAEDDKAIDQKVREIVTTTWHSLGTCKMAPKEKMGVTDGTLSVHGMKGLKLADLSVPPENVGANTGNTAFLVGEKAADIFIKELGLGETRSRL